MIVIIYRDQINQRTPTFNIQPLQTMKLFILESILPTILFHQKKYNLILSKVKLIVYLKHKNPGITCWWNFVSLSQLHQHFKNRFLINLISPKKVQTETAKSYKKVLRKMLVKTFIRDATIEVSKFFLSLPNPNSENCNGNAKTFVLEESPYFKSKTN